MNTNDHLSRIPPELQAAPWLKTIVDFLQEQARVIREQSRVIQEQAEQNNFPEEDCTGIER